mgnify:CR=1 FL=1
MSWDGWLSFTFSHRAFRNREADMKFKNLFESAVLSVIALSGIVRREKDAAWSATTKKLSVIALSGIVRRMRCVSLARCRNGLSVIALSGIVRRSSRFIQSIRIASAFSHRAFRNREADSFLLPFFSGSHLSVIALSGIVRRGLMTTSRRGRCHFQSSRFQES